MEAFVKPLLRTGRIDSAIAQLRGTGSVLAATVVQGGNALFGLAQWTCRR
ncbi:MAG: hypothetical protein M3374_00060 [Pseudomonadota bacterium]|nr:hypothetical protein [Pseudomonadota bacterium]